MALADTLRWASTFPMSGSWPEEYDRPDPEVGPNWRWLDLWEQENPNPGAPGFDDWHAEKQKMHARVWVASCLPQFRVFDWPDEDVALARQLVARHVCGVCGRSDDHGCTVGC